VVWIWTSKLDFIEYDLVVRGKDYTTYMEGGGNEHKGQKLG
jgi:hypothetical protein